ncbi:hypothetical protein [Bacillus sp. 1P06AnD]|uniref:hypothetical protein n=1 Tax=Bacillus sp. 1P06AnD TaxID=3132208 RepID=UPI0039A3D846
MAKKSLGKLFLTMLIALCGIIVYLSPTKADEAATNTPTSNSYQSSDILDMVSPNDSNLEDYGLTTNANNEVISIPGDPYAAYNDEQNPNTRAVPPGDTGGSVYTYPGSNITARRGDILVTDTTVDGNSNYVGHTAVVTSTNTVSMSGATYGPNLEALSTFLKRKNVYVIRLADVNAATNAANWASRMYNDTSVKIKYSVLGSIGDPDSLSPSYCSKFVYQAYNKGNNKKLLAGVGVNGLIIPSQLIDKNNYPTNTKLVYKKGTMVSNFN